MALQYSIDTPNCRGVNHAEFSIDGRFAIFTCEYAKSVAKIDLVDKKVAGYLKFSKGGMPQDVRISPDGRIFYVADMKADGVFVVDADKFTEIGHIKTGIGAHGLYPSRNGTKLYVANRGVARVYGPPKGKGSVSVIDFATRKVIAKWVIPNGGSPDMGNVSDDGKVLWLSGRYHQEVYAFDTSPDRMTFACSAKTGTTPAFFSASRSTTAPSTFASSDRRTSARVALIFERKPNFGRRRSSGV